MSRVKEKLINDLRLKAEGMLNEVLAAVEQTGEKGSFSLKCDVVLKDPDTRKVTVKIGGSVTLGQPTETTEAALVGGTQLDLFEEPELPEEPSDPEEETGEANVEEPDDSETEVEAEAEATV